MNKTPGRTAAPEQVLAKHDPSNTPAAVVCTALALAVLVLVIRIAATTW
jgi:hypothetical protein